MERTSFSLVKEGVGRVNVTVLKNSLILSYPCETYSECTEYQTTLNAGQYKLEVWGAEGGTRSPDVSGGKGGYSSGILTISSPTSIFISIGSKGGFTTADREYSQPTFGGGGFSAPYYASDPYCYPSNGGGGTDIRIERNELESRIIVGGGGGGTGKYTSVYPGGFGGGLSGGKGADSISKGGLNGSQTAGGASVGGYSQAGSFGKGGSTLSNNYCACGGGGGWFGGSNGYDWSAGGGGGSGYVFTKESHIPKDYRFDHTSKFILTRTTLRSGNEPFNTPFGINETGHIGNGFAKITFLSLSSRKKLKSYIPHFHSFVPFIFVVALSSNKQTTN